MVGRMCTSRVAARSADFSGRLGRRSAGGDHQSVGHAVARSNPSNEPELPGVQVSADTRPSVEQSVPAAHTTRGHSSHVQAAWVHAHVAHHATRGVRSSVLRRATRAEQQAAQRTRLAASLQLDAPRALHHALTQLASHTTAYWRRRCCCRSCFLSIGCRCLRCRWLIERVRICFSQQQQHRRF